MNFSDPATRKSDLVPVVNKKKTILQFGSRKIDGEDLPTNTIGTFGEKCRTSGHHFVATLSNDVRLDIE